MKKLWLLGLMLIFVLSLTSCAKLNIPDGDIKDFVSNFDGEKAFESVDYIYCQIFNTYYEGDYDDGNDIILGKHVSNAICDKRDNEYYYLLSTRASGNYVGEDARYNFNERTTLCYANYDKTGVYVAQVTDGVADVIEYDFDDVYKSCQSVFFTEVSGGYHTGGIYYGDYILKNISKYYKHFYLYDEDTLQFEINISTPTEDGNEILNVHKFSVDKYGLVKTVKTIAYYICGDKVTHTLVTEMYCVFDLKFEKYRDLDLFIKG